MGPSALTLHSIVSGGAAGAGAGTGAGVGAGAGAGAGVGAGTGAGGAGAAQATKLATNNNASGINKLFFFIEKLLHLDFGSLILLFY